MPAPRRSSRQPSDGVSRDADPGAAPAESAAQRARRLVKERILDGTYADGTLLSEGEVAAGLGISRTPVREAFVELQAEGLLRLYPRRGALVVPVSPEEADAVMETRWVVERHALETALDRDDAQTFTAMADVLAGQRALLGDDAAFAERDREFHRLAVAATGNRILIDLYDSLRERQRRMVRRSLGSDARRGERILGEHEALVDALRAGERERALLLLREHLTGARAGAD